MNVYFITCRDIGMVKIGCAHEPRSRIMALQAGNPFDLVIEALVDGDYDDERQFHAQFSEHRIRAEWFRIVPEIEAVIALNRAPPQPKLTWREKMRLSSIRASKAKQRPLDLELPIRRERAA